MKPLSQETNFASSSERVLADLVRNASGYQASPFRKRLIRTRLGARGRMHAGGHGLRYAAVAISLVCTSAAAATFGYRYVVADDAAAPAEPPVTTHTAPPAAKPAKPAPKSEARREQPAATDATPAVEREPSRARVPAERPKAKAESEDPSQMLEAVRALRKEGNPEQAQKLLDGYLATHPSGALSEDALALSIEAAAARRDPRASEYARRYLAQYPKGRFRQVALRALNANR